MWASPGIFTEVVHLFLATDLYPVTARPEFDEILEVHWLPLSDAVTASLDGTYTDAKTIIAILRAARHLGVLR
jgi:ADP-ribose pyrophosphatase